MMTATVKRNMNNKKITFNSSLCMLCMYHTPTLASTANYKFVLYIPACVLALINSNQSALMSQQDNARRDYSQRIDSLNELPR